MPVVPSALAQPNRLCGTLLTQITDWSVLKLNQGFQPLSPTIRLPSSEAE